MNLNIKKVTYKKLKNIPVLENEEPLVIVNKFDDSIVFNYEGFKKPEGMSDNIFVRVTIAKKLSLINKALRDINPDFVLKIVYGYRPLSVQKKYFNQIKRRITDSSKIFSNELELFEEIHKFIAVPQTAGHPAGAAIDLTIFNKKLGINLDMGSRIDDFHEEKKMSWLARNLTEEQTTNRKILLDLMLRENFAPFWGEWWHYSFGDREWAAYYNHKTAIFGAVDGLM